MRMGSATGMASSSSAADPASVQPLAPDQSSLGSINMDDLLNEMYSDATEALPEDRTAEEVWKEIVTGREPRMTLEVFLTKAGAVAPDDVAIAPDDVAIAPVAPTPPQFQGYGVEVGGFGSEIECGERVGSGKRRRAAEEEVMGVDKVTQQRQKRMIKNRESAARSRERKQAYTVELEALVIQLETDNARLVREEAERSRKRFKKLMENLIPVGDKQRPPLRAHRRVHSIG